MDRITTTRRGLLAIAAGGVTLAACGSEGDGPSRERRDARAAAAATLNSTLAWELAVVAAYRAAIPVARGGARRTLAQIAAQEASYAERLTGLVRRAGGDPARPKPFAVYRSGFPELADQADALAFLADVEERSVRKCLEALPRLSGEQLRRPLARMAVGQGRHLALVRDLDGLAPAPHAFVTGTQ